MIPPADRLASSDVQIALPQRFAFENHREFRAGYVAKQRPVYNYVLDFKATRLIDSAGLGMLLQLCEYARLHHVSVRMVNVTTEIRETLVVAGFQEATEIG